MKPLLLSALASLLAIGRIFAQGELLPPGPPAPMMKSLDQVEPRIIVNATNTPGDASNTFIISAPGSYYFTGNVTGEPDKHGISVQANDVTLDLNGFALIGGGGGAFRGVNVPAEQLNLSVRNGTVRGWTDGGVRAEAARNMLAEKLRLSGNTGAVGLYVGLGSIITDCVATENGVGFRTPDRTHVSHCISTVNASHGFDCASFVTLLDCTASRNGGAGIVLLGSGSVIRGQASRNMLQGIHAGTGCTIADCTAGSNVGDGIRVEGDSTIRNCTAFANTGAGISVLHGCHVTGNTCNNNAVGVAVIGPDNGGERNRIDGNSCGKNQIGVSVYGLQNFIVRNSASGNTSQAYSIFPPFFNRAGPIVGDTAGLETAPAWANFTH